MEQIQSRRIKEIKKNRRKIKINAVTIWLIIEGIAVVAVFAAAVVRNVYGESRSDEPTYQVPTSETETLTDITDIKLPTDLLAESGSEDGEAFSGDVYELNYSEDVMTGLEQMSVEQKIDMLLVTTPEALTGKDNVTIAGDVFKDAYNADPVTGLYFADSNFKSEEDGMRMLQTLRGWSRDVTGMNVFIGYRGDMTDASEMSGRGINLYLIDHDDENAADLLTSAGDNHMLAAYLAPIETALAADEEGVFYIAKTEDASAITEAVINGRTFLYMTEDFSGVRQQLTEAVNQGNIPNKALDKAAGYAMTLRQTLTDIRSEDMEREPEPETPASKPAASTKKSTPKKEMTPEEQAAAAAAEMQKQAEAALKELQKQAEAAAKAAAEAAGGQ